MKWLEKSTDKGILKYRMPNIEEGYYFLSAIERMSNAQDVFKVKGKFVSMMSDMLSYKDIGFETYEDFLSDRENNAQAVADIVTEVFDTITRELGKKN